MTTETFVLCKTSFDGDESTTGCAACDLKVIKCEWSDDGRIPGTFSVKVIKEMTTFRHSLDAEEAKAYQMGVKDGVCAALDAAVSAIGADFESAMYEWLHDDDDAGLNDGYAPLSVLRWKVEVLEFAFSDQAEAELLNVAGTLWAPEWFRKGKETDFHDDY